MRIRWLGWAGVEIEADGVTVVIDPLADPGATFAPLGEEASRVTLPTVVPPQAGAAVAGLVSHLHRDHADAGALAGPWPVTPASTSPPGREAPTSRTSPWPRRTRSSSERA